MPTPVPYALGFLIAEIEEMKRLAEEHGLGTLAYNLELALLEGKRQAELRGKRGLEPTFPAGS